MSLDLALRPRRIMVVLGASGIALLISFLVGDERSPLYRYFLWHVTIPNLWAALNLPALFLGVAVGGGAHQPSLAGYLLGVAAQWGILGYVASVVLMRPTRAKARRGKP